jgi:hypothetical protein
VAFTAHYLSRVLASVPEHSGIALLHSRLGPGWQGMSFDDVRAERDRLASAVAGRTGLPLLGLTWGTDGTWSARMWGRAEPFRYERVDVACVRVIGPDALSRSYHPRLRPEPAPLPSQQATVSVWGTAAQHDLARLRVGIVGLGSVGSIIAEALSRVGVSDVTLIDHDRLEQRNLDRTLHSTLQDAESGTYKVRIAARTMADSHTAADLQVTDTPASVLSADGTAAALDCDVLLSCVYRPAPRWQLNTIAYAHLIPVVDGGILVRVTEAGRPLHVDWRIHTVGPGLACLACLACLGALRRSDVALDLAGLLDDPDYLRGLSEEDRQLINRRNVFPFSLAVAAHQVLQLVGLVAGTARVGGIGPQHYAAHPGTMTAAPTRPCEPDCEVAALTSTATPLGP